MTELATKLQRVRQLLDERGLEALVLQRNSSFAWATCGGASYVNTASTTGAATLVITRTARFLITNNIEAERLLNEQGLAGQGWEMLVSPWHSPDGALARVTRGLRCGADSAALTGAADLSADLARLRAALSPPEGERFRVLGRRCAQAMEAAVQALRPGQTEHEIAARLAQAAERQGVQAVVNLIATDERAFHYRHPVPTGKRLERYAMLVLCGRWKGLVCSITRLVHFGPLPAEVRRRGEAAAQVDAAFIVATRPGCELRQIFQQAVAKYAEVGFPDEWRHHHQGGAAGYEPREYLATPSSTDVVAAGQAFAWNPSIAGTKSEDTILVDETGHEVVTEIEHWPTLEVPLAGRAALRRPAILEVD